VATSQAAVRGRKLAAVILLAACSARAAAAQPLSAVDSLTDEQIESRTAFIEEHLDRHRRHAERWVWGWTIVNGGAAVALGILGGLADKRVDRVSYLSQAGLATVGVVDLHLLRPIPAVNGADSIRALPGSTLAERRLRLQRAERLLERSARRPGEPWDLWPHLGNLLINTAIGVGVWKAGNSRDGLISGISGAAVGELYLLSQPTGWKEDLEAYHRFVSGPREPRVSWTLVPMGLGLAVHCRF